jgi:tetratricopeptide (TPR) repeat protein
VTAKWLPTDDELDAVARTLPVADRAIDRVEQERTSLLAQAGGVAQLDPARRLPWLAGAGLALAAAAVLLIWLAARPESRVRIFALGEARFERAQPWPDFVVRIDGGRVAIAVSKLDAGERFRATTSDAEIDGGAAQFVIAADHGTIRNVAVSEGRVELRWRGQPPVFLAGGDSWSPPLVAQRDTIEPPRVIDEPTVPVEPPVLPTPKSAPTHPPKHVHHVPANGSAVEPPPIVASEAPARPGEAEFRAGVAGLRANDAAGATRSFAAACRIAQREALGEDACFWVGAAAKRAGDPATARDALTKFLAAYPKSPRTGEAAALLGWILYDAGELDAAQQRFDAAAHDRVAKVVDSATRGLEAIRRKRATP